MQIFFSSHILRVHILRVSEKTNILLLNYIVGFKNV